MPNKQKAKVFLRQKNQIVFRPWRSFFRQIGSFVLVSCTTCATCLTQGKEEGIFFLSLAEVGQYAVAAASFTSKRCVRRRWSVYRKYIGKQQIHGGVRYVFIRGFDKRQQRYFSSTQQLFFPLLRYATATRAVDQYVCSEKYAFIWTYTHVRVWLYNSKPSHIFLIFLTSYVMKKVSRILFRRVPKHLGYLVFQIAPNLCSKQLLVLAACDRKKCTQMLILECIKFTTLQDKQAKPKR